MIVLDYNSVEWYNTFCLAHSTITKFEELLNKKYGVDDDSKTTFSLVKISLGIMFSLLGNLEGKVILDLGCGSKKEHLQQEQYRQFEPWLMRLLYEMKIDAMGIDIAHIPDEMFKGYALDLLKPNSLDFIASHSVNLVNANGLFNSPMLVYQVTGRTKFIQREDELLAANKLYTVLRPQLKRILKPNGYFVYQNVPGIYLDRNNFKLLQPDLK